MNKTTQEGVVWVQVQAPAGNWVDDTGFPYGADSSRTYRLALAEAKHNAAFLRNNRGGREVRVVRKFIEIL